VLSHLEEIPYYGDTQLPGLILFLDFEKAFDRLDRGWIVRCMSAVGFGPGLQRWVHILHEGTAAGVAINGWHTFTFPVQSEVFQGSQFPGALRSGSPAHGSTRKIFSDSSRSAAKHLPSGDV
jgi:hypothetical protein